MQYVKLETNLKVSRICRGALAKSCKPHPVQDSLR